jgi:hypothetical protein
VNEANLAFELNTGLFEAIEILAAENKDYTSELESEEEELVLETPLKPPSEAQTEKLYPFASVAAFIAAGPCFSSLKLLSNRL